jgi:hypothetical protein
MANKPELREDQEVTPEHLHKLKLIDEEKKRKKSAVVKKQWIEVYQDRNSKFGGKVLLMSQMANGNVHSYYLGRQKKGGDDAIRTYKAKGVQVR